MKENEIMLMRYGDMQDMIACMQIENGGANQKIKKKKTYEEVMRLE